MPLDPDAQRTLDLLRAAGLPPVETTTPQEARSNYRKARSAIQAPPAEVAEIRPLAAPGGPGEAVPMRFYRGLGVNAATPGPGLVFFHGGGWVIGDLDTHDGVCRLLANAARCVVISVDYRLAPEHKFPVAVEDGQRAMRWIASNADALGIDPRRIAVGGDSAGGNLAAVMAILARDGVAPPVCAQVLMYPATDFRMDYPSYRRITTGFPLTASTTSWFAGHYLRDRNDIMDWRASPLLAPDLSGTAAATVLTATYDPLQDEGEAYARRLENAGVRVTRIHFGDQMHGFLTMGGVIRAAGTAVDMMAAGLRDAFSR